MSYVFWPIAKLVLWWRALKQKRLDRAITRLDNHMDEELRILDPKAASECGVFVTNEDVIMQKNGETPEARLLRYERQRARRRQMIMGY